MKKILGVCALLVWVAPSFAADQCLMRAAGSAQELSEPHAPIVVSTLSRLGGRDTEVFQANPPGGSNLTGSEGFRIASITKTYVAATVLRLWEDGRIDLQSPITQWLPADWLELLVRGGYDPSKITVRHLLTHTSGLADHAQAPQFIETIKANPQTVWTRSSDIQHLIDWTHPVGAPGERFSYSDTGYVLLGAIVERVTGETLPSAVRKELALDKLGVPSTYWEQYEPARGRVRAHQVYEGIDTYNWSPTMDLYGGGGIVASTKDLTTFFNALLSGRVFRHPETLALMKSSEGLPEGSPYRLGVFAYNFEGVAAIGHSGFWGTIVAEEPISGQTIAGAVTDRSDYPKLKGLVIRYLHEVATQGAEAACNK